MAEDPGGTTDPKETDHDKLLSKKMNLIPTFHMFYKNESYTLRDIKWKANKKIFRRK